MKPGFGDLVRWNGVTCRVRARNGDTVLLVATDPCPRKLRDRLREPVKLSDLDAPQTAAGSCLMAGRRPESCS